MHYQLRYFTVIKKHGIVGFYSTVLLNLKQYLKVYIQTFLGGLIAKQQQAQANVTW